MPAPKTSSNKAYLETEGGDTIHCLFNPADLALSQVNGWAGDVMPGRGVPTLRYTGAASGQLRLTLFFDTTDTGEAVTQYTGKIVKLMEVDTSLPGSDEKSNNTRPPWVKFHWGDFHSFPAVVSSLDLTFEYFSSTGTPLRARAAMVLTQYKQDMAFGPQNPTSGTPRPHRVHRVQPGETLDRIAALHLGDSTRWRSIAEVNNIEDPLALKPGRLLAIPGPT
ncbi:MAG TPA: LysM peptidoglycan-binding domain-containing protein [Acidimicrobiales bacterium]|nr:LysM peptidoglycan-binding domain-containing protein [Acidimicrobiales bacterium]